MFSFYSFYFEIQANHIDNLIAITLQQFQSD